MTGNTGSVQKHEVVDLTLTRRRQFSTFICSKESFDYRKLSDQRWKYLIFRMCRVFKYFFFVAYFFNNSTLESERP